MGKDHFHVPECVFYACCGSKCKKRGGKEVFKLLKSYLKESGLKRQVQVIKTGCTDRCKMGPVLSVMPQNQWFLEVSGERAIEIFDQFTEKNKR